MPRAAAGIGPASIAFPQDTTVPSFFSATAYDAPAEIATAPLNPAGTSVSPFELEPQAATVPSAFNATPKPLPAEIAMTSFSPEGRERASTSQAITVPSLLSAIDKLKPDATATMPLRL